MATSEDPSEIWYDANCHCAAIKYRVKLPSLHSQEIISCNCSICCKNGYLNVRPKRKDVVFVQGEDLIKDYRFGKKEYNHKFCPLCGSSLLVEPLMEDKDFMAVNVRMIKDIELDKLKYWYFDGRAKLDPPYEA